MLKAQRPSIGKEVYKFYGILLEVDQIVNTILDYIHGFMQLQPDPPSWRNKDELFDIEIIIRENQQEVINRLNEHWFSTYFQP